MQTEVICVFYYVCELIKRAFDAQLQDRRSYLRSLYGTQAEEIAAKMGLGDLPKAFDFPVGTMFWMRAATLKPFIDLGLNWEDYPREPLAEDGTMLHAIERLFGIVPRVLGHDMAVTNVAGLTR